MAKKPAARGKDAAANDRPEVDDADEIIRAAKIDVNRVIGSTGDMLLAELRGTREWMKLTEDEQNRLIKRCGDQARAIVAGVISGIAHRGLPHVKAAIADKGAYEDGFFVTKITIPMNAQSAHLLSESRGSDIQLVFADAAEFESAMTAQAIPDQKPLIEENAARDERDGEGVEGESFDPDTGEVTESPPAMAAEPAAPAPGM